MGYRIKELREAKGISASDLAAMCGISRQTIFNMETGRTQTTSSKTLLAIARALDTTVDALFCPECLTVKQ